MADPLRRTFLAKLRGRKAKAKETKEGNEKVCHSQTERDCVSQEMRGEQSCVNGDPVPRCTNLGFPGVGVTDRYNRTEIKRFYTHGDSIGFGLCELSEAVNQTDGRDVTNKETNVTVLSQKGRKTLEGDFELSLNPTEAPQVFEYVAGNLTESRLIEIFESSLEFHRDFTMQSPTFFPTELEIPSAALGLREGAPRHHSVDSEDEDYYDNQILPFYESSAQTASNNRNSLLTNHTLEPDQSTRETTRLKSQLKEAYHLLINTMHNINLDVPVEDKGFVDQGSTSSDSSCSVKHPGSDSCSAEETGPAKPGFDSVFFALCREALNRSESSQDVSKADDKPILQRSLSDSKVKYSSVSQNQREKPPKESCHERLVVPSNPLEVLETAAQTTTDGTSLKNPGVTVNKMQEWMEKGRVLSSEMKLRIMGASGRANPSAQLRTRAAPLESIIGPSNLDQAPFNNITVSKKRNWLQQSSTRGFLPSEDLPAPHALEDHVPPAADGNLPPLSLRNTRNVSSEENDVDDEREIWYNPIPEDEDVEGVDTNCVKMTQTAQANMAGVVMEGHKESLGGDGTVLGCRAQEENLTIKVTDSSEQSTGGLSPPSSPNPVKRSTAINWSFPDKIKSPRTVRKLSMKMKKLPELSRKLSIKGNPATNGLISNALSEHQTPSPKTNGIADLVQSQSRLALGGVTAALASGNVIWRYHLDSSVSTQHSFDKRRSNNAGIPKSASKGGYLSDGDSPELVAKSGKHANSQRKHGKTRDRDSNGNSGSPKIPGTDLDIDAFRSYSFTEQPKCLTFISGLMSLHFYGAEDLKPPRADSRDIYCAIQVDSVNKARTALLTCRTAFLDMDHTFNIDLENAQHLKLVVFSWESTPRRNRLCCHGTVVLPALFRVSKTHQLAVRLEPRGMIYVKLSLMEQRQNSLDGSGYEKQVFGVEAHQLVEREASGLMVPLLIEKCICEIETRGCQVVGLYRLCGSAAVKKELREAFERNSHSVELSENNYPDINVITGVLKDYLRELPHPLITKPLYERVLEAMAKRPLLMGSNGCENEAADSEHTVSLLEILPEVEKVTLRKLLDHLKRVASHQEQNKMSCQNLAVCFGPVLLSQRQEASCVGKRVFLDSEELASALHFKKHIEVLHYLLQLWPVVDLEGTFSSPVAALTDPITAVPAAVRRRKERPQVLNLTQTDISGVLRPRAGRLDSPSNRYAGDWSACQETYLKPSCPDEADYDDVPSEDPSSTEQADSPTATQDVVSKEEFSEVKEAVEGVEELQVEVEEEASEEEDNGELDRLYVEEPLSIDSCDEILPNYMERQPKEHTYQAYMKIQEISPVLSNRVNLRDLQESIDTLIGNLERELNKNKLNLGY